MKSWIKYYRQSILDGLKREIKHTPDNSIYIDGFDIFSDLISSKSAHYLIDIVEKKHNSKKGITKVDNPNWERLNEIEVLISPYALIALPDHGDMVDITPQRPFYYMALLSRAGLLQTPDDTFPVFQRRYLEPIARHEGQLFISTMDIVDESISVAEPIDDEYENYISYIDKVFKQASGADLANFNFEGYCRIDQAAIVIPLEGIYAARSIAAMYDNILSEQKIPMDTLAEILSNKEQTDKSASIDDILSHTGEHLGQMTDLFALSPSQRLSIGTMSKYRDHKVFAINGPPGTGKTTILQTIVADEIVKKALEGNDPPIILACSNNNQAVKNILDSYTRVQSEPSLLSQRWLSFVQGYGCYLPKSRATEQELKGYNYQKLQGDGIFSIENDQELIAQEKKKFVEQAILYFDQVIPFTEIASMCQAQIKDKAAVLGQLSTHWQEKLNGDALLQKYLALTNNSRNIKDLTADSFIAKEKTRLLTIESNMHSYFQSETWWMSLCCMLGLTFGKKLRIARLQPLVRESSITVDATCWKETTILTNLSRLIDMLTDIASAYDVWDSYLLKNELEGNIPLTREQYNIQSQESGDTLSIYDVLDQSFRYEMFHLAVHYWEARWLKAVEVKYQENRGKADSIVKWRRWAMLTPCFVSTYYMLPKFFSYSIHLGKDDQGVNRWTNGHLFDFLDLLLVDEAGQVAPEIGTAAFALAKKTVVVGDIQQIPPIWNITGAIDKGNLVKSSLLDHTGDIDQYEIFNSQGRISSNGSIMSMALHSTSIIDQYTDTKGSMLTEHRRCYDEIIRYCNTLAYNGQLRPLRGPAPESNLFPPMGFIPNVGLSELVGNSRKNSEEALAIVQWLIMHRSQIEQTYGAIEDYVGVITPFVAQKNELHNILKKAKFDTTRMTIGTIHSLQGAERRIVLFSAVYTPHDVGTMFFDLNVNMLNVAVSRAQDSFICFGNDGVFNMKSNLPSGILKRHLQTIG